MPTGYTSKLHDGEDQTFAEFAMECARAFGALILLRDSPEAPIPDEFRPGDYALKALKKAERRLAEVEDWTDEEAGREGMDELDRAVKAHRESVEEARRIKKRYERMLETVRLWRPPTPDHEELKRFMIQQLTESIKFDCHESDSPVCVTDGRKYRATQVEKAREDIAFYRKEHEKEVTRAKERTEWVRALRESLKGSGCSPRK